MNERIQDKFIKYIDRECGLQRKYSSNLSTSLRDRRVVHDITFLFGLRSGYNIDRPSLTECVLILISTKAHQTHFCFTS